MEHAEALERIEIAAAEPEGLDRLMAGDTADAAAIAGHLAGCPSCVSELGRIRRSAALAREVIRTQPDPALRARTLAYVAAVGVARGEGAAGPADVPGSADSQSPPTAAPSGEPDSLAAHRRTRRLGWIAAAAAVLVVVAGAGYLAGAPSRDTLDDARREVAILEEAAAATVRIGAQPDATRVALVATADAPDAEGSLLFSATIGELAMVATDLAMPADDEEYGCWIEVDGSRERIGRMYRAGDVWTWAGPVDGLDALPPGSVFGVSLGPEGGSPESVPVLTGGV